MLKVGDQVQVNPAIVRPDFGWGKYVTHSSVGVLAHVPADDDGGICLVNFPGHPGWMCYLKELVPAKRDGYGNEED